MGKLSLENKQSVVVIDDNFAIRYVLKLFLKKFVNQNYQVYSSSEGVQGIGYVLLSNPEFVLIDTTLPQYSGRELFEFLMSNQRIQDGSMQIILMNETGNIPNIPSNFTVISKSDPAFLPKLFSFLSLKGVIAEHGSSRFLMKNLQSIMKWANWGDIITRRMFAIRPFFRLFFVPLWVFIQFTISIGITFLQLFIGQVEDSNLYQDKKDLKSYRVRVYPSLLTLFISLMIAVVQFSLFLGGGLLIFKGADKIQPADAAYSNGYNYRRAITIDNTKVDGTSNLTNFPVLVSGTYSYLATTANSGKVENANGYDIIFTSDEAGTTQLDHEIESYNASTGAINFWVEIPTIYYSTDTTFYIFYGNSSISASQENVAGVWDSHYLGVWHMAEDPSGTAPQILNSSSTSGVNGTTSGTMTSADQVSSMVNGGIDFDGTDDMVQISNATNLSIAAEGAVEVWMKPTDNSSFLYDLNDNYSIADVLGYYSQGIVDIDVVDYAGFMYVAAATDSNFDGSLLIAYTDVDMNDYSSFSMLSSPVNLATWGGQVSVAVESDGMYLYYAYMFNESDGTTRISIAQGDDQPSIGSWTAITPPSVNYGVADDSTIDITLIEDKIYYAVYVHDDATKSLLISSSNFDGTGQTSWVSLTLPSVSTNNGGSTDVTIVSDGQHIYYCLVTTSFGFTGGSGSLYIGNSTLSGTGMTYTYNKSLSSPSLWGASGGLSLIGDQLFVNYFSIPFDYGNGNAEFSTFSLEKTGSTPANSYSVNVSQAPSPSPDPTYFHYSNASVLYEGRPIAMSFVNEYGYPTLDLYDNYIYPSLIVSQPSSYQLYQAGGGMFYTSPYGGSYSFADVTTSSHNYITVVNDHTNNDYMNFYYNGNNLHGAPNPSGLTSSTSFAYLAGSYGNYFSGNLDEIRIASTAFSDGWVLTNYNAISSPSTFYTVGSEAEAPPNVSPTVSSVVLNGGSNITLTAGTTTTITLTGVVTDTNGYADISSASGKIYRSGVESSCTSDDLNCYTIASCSLSNCAGNSCDVSCSTDLQYFTDATDSSGSYPSEYWLGYIEAVDSQSATGNETSPADTVDVASLHALDIVSPTITYGGISPGDDTGAVNQQVQITNIGNVVIDLEVSGSNLCDDYPTCSGGYLEPTAQEYSVTGFTYGGGSTLGSTSQAVNISIPRTTSLPASGNQSSLYWGIGIGSGIYPGAYSGNVYIVATNDS